MSYLPRNIGQIGEKIAEKHLTCSGFTIIDRNFHSRYGEIDLIARENDMIVFVEVKNYSNTNLLHPSAAIYYRKRQKIIKTAKIYIMNNGFYDFNCRFDVIAICRNGNEIELQHIRGAFEVD